MEQKKVRKKRHVLQKKKGTPATCTEYGWTDRIFCTVCNTVTQRRVRIAPLGHTIVTDPAVEATCTESGLTEGKHCPYVRKLLPGKRDSGKRSQDRNGSGSGGNLYTERSDRGKTLFRMQGSDHRAESNPGERSYDRNRQGGKGNL